MKTGFTCSCFDLLHCGHVMMLREAKEQCDYLIVGLQTDPTVDRPTKNKPIQTIVERYIQISAIRYVDEIFVYETEKDLDNLIKSLDINIRIVGEEYRDKDFTGKDYCVQTGIEIYYNRRRHGFSSSELKDRVRNG